MRRSHQLAFAAVACLGWLQLTACPPPTELAPGINDSTYVAVISQLQRITLDSTVDDSVRRLSRTATLQRYGVTVAGMEAAAQTLARDPQHALRVWQVIDRRLRGQAGPVTKIRTNKAAS